SLSSANGSRARRRPRGRWRRGCAERRARGRAGGRETSSAALERSGWKENRRDERDERRELGRLRLELPSSLRRDAIELRLAPELGGAPLGVDPAVALHAIERGIERALFDAQPVAASLLEPAHDAVSVARTEGERFQDEGVERAVQCVHVTNPGSAGPSPR